MVSSNFSIQRAFALTNNDRAEEANTARVEKTSATVQKATKSTKLIYQLVHITAQRLLLIVRETTDLSRLVASWPS